MQHEPGQLEAVRRALMAKHLKAGPIERHKLGILIDNVNRMIREPGDEVLRRQFLTNLKDHEVRHGHG